MTSQKIKVGLLATPPEARESLSSHAEATQMAELTIVGREYCALEDDHPTQQFLDAQPEIIIVDMSDERAAIQTLFILHTVLPESWLYACSSSTDPQLIIETMQAGAREFLPKPVTARSLALAFGRYVDEKQRLRTDIKTRGKTFAVTAAKGGAGATSVAINLAATVADDPTTRVALVDLNSPLGDAAAYLNVKPQFSVSDAISAGPRLDPVLLETFLARAHGIAILPGPKQPIGGASSPGTAAMAKLLRVLSLTYTHTFIDLPSSLDPELLQVVTDLSESILVVMTPELPAVWRTHRLLTTLSAMGCADRMRLVVNRDNSRDEIDEREIKRALNHPIYFRLPNNYNKAIESINKGKPAVALDHSGLAAGYRKLASLMTGLSLARKRRGFLKLFS